MQHQASINTTQPATYYPQNEDPTTTTTTTSSSYPNYPYADATSSLVYDATSYYAPPPQPLPFLYTQSSGATSASGYYQDPNLHDWASTLYASSLATNTTQQSGAAQVHLPSWKNAANYKILKKKKNPIQHVWCDVCKIECNSKEILDSHKQGKKHKKNLEKLKESLAPAPVGVPNNPTIGPQEKPKKRKAKEPEEDLETKKKKIVAGGTAENAVKTCLICNVVCNSELVFRYHLAGQKHLSMMKKGKPLSWP